MESKGIRRDAFLNRAAILNRCGKSSLLASLHQTRAHSPCEQIEIARICLTYGPTYADKLYKITNSQEILKKVADTAWSIIRQK